MTDRDSASNNAPPSQQQVCNTSGRTIGGMCLNWKVIGALALVGLGIWAVAPNLIFAAAPILLFAACPLAMWLMMRGMTGQQPGSHDRHAANEGAPPRDIATLKAEHARLTAELEDLERDVVRAKVGDDSSPEAWEDPRSAQANGPPRSLGDDIN